MIFRYPLSYDFIWFPLVPTKNMYHLDTHHNMISYCMVPQQKCIEKISKNTSCGLSASLRRLRFSKYPKAFIQRSSKSAYLAGSRGIRPSSKSPRR